MAQDVTCCICKAWNAILDGCRNKTDIKASRVEVLKRTRRVNIQLATYQACLNEVNHFNDHFFEVVVENNRVQLIFMFSRVQVG
jgi:hypothetical protein